MLIKPPGERDGATVTLSDSEHKEATRRTALRAAVVFETVRREGEQELERPVASLAFSGLAAGLSMGFSLVATGLIRAALPPRRLAAAALKIWIHARVPHRHPRTATALHREHGDGDRTATGRPEQTRHVAARRAFVDRRPRDECARCASFRVGSSRTRTHLHLK